MNSCNVHFVLKNKLSYKDLVPAFPQILDIILEENDHFQEEGDANQRGMFLQMNMADLELNRKPEGYNRKGCYRLMFPIGEKEFYISMHGVKPGDVKRVTERIEDALNSCKPKLKFDIVTEHDID